MDDPFLIIDPVLTDRGSRYAVSGGPVADRAAVEAALTGLRRGKRFAKATHNSWAAILPGDGGQPVPLRADDGEAGAGAVILRMLERDGMVGHLVVVTRWFGGVRLGGDRFRNISEAVRIYLARRRDGG